MGKFEHLSLAELTELFRKLGAPNPKIWASSQLDEGFDQLSRFVFLRQAWRLVVDENNSDWINRQIAFAAQSPDAPMSGAGHALRSLREKGATEEELNELVRSSQIELLSNFLYMLADPELPEPEVRAINWGVYTIDDEGRPNEELVGLHESLLGTDPTGREGRPFRKQ